MASISAELRVGGHVFPLLRFTYEVHQSTDRRGRVVTKVRFGLVQVLLNVPRTDFLKAWAADPHKRLAVDLVSLDATSAQALETLHMNGAYCVFYREEFNRGDVHTGSYVLQVNLSDPDGFTITAGGPAAYVAPAAREHGTPPEALQRVPIIPQLLPQAAAVVEETLLARLWQGMLRGLTGPAGMTAGLLLMSTNGPNDPGYKSEWNFKNLYPTPTDKDRARLAQLEAGREAGSLSADEQAELLALMAKVKGIHVQHVGDLDVQGPLRGDTVSLPGFYYISLAFNKRTDADRQALRNRFGSVREKFMNGLATDPTKLARLKQAGLTDADLADMQAGDVPDGWQVHHKLPLDDGGDNSVHNLMLIKNEPYHKALTNYQNAATHKMKAGETRIIKWPVHNGYVYP